MFAEAFRNKKVWVSGHTGFKGSWLCEWLLRLGADVTGFSLPPDADSALFTQLELASRLRHQIGDVRETGAVTESIRAARPDFVFHLAAQALVRYSYDHPLETYATNVMGTAHVLQALRSLQYNCAAVIVTTDKCYENREMDYAYTEEDPLGGHDPYSSSKGAAELVVASYRRSFFNGHPVKIASARAGNVIGGGDWAIDRIVPDCIRALQRGDPVSVRNPHATRPWQHVLEPLSGYLWLAAGLHGQSKADLGTAFNFGPDQEANRSVGELVREVLKHWPGRWEDKSDPCAHHEAKLLMLSTAKAKRLLRWRPTWNFETAIANTVGWYRTVNDDPVRAGSATRAQMAEYETAARTMQIAWATP
jgi:CDP-glucose 4,6-dehydratase